MKKLPNSILGCMTAMLFLCAVSERGSGADLALAEAAVRKADEDWAMAMAGNAVDAWMFFYAADAIVLLPNDQLADGTDLVRRAVTRLLAPPQPTIAWHTTKVQMSRSGVAAYLAGTYELRFNDSHGAATAERGTLLRVWRKQSDGNWKCVVDSWNPTAPLPKAAEVIPEPIVNSPASESMPAHASTKYGDMPVHYNEAIQRYFKEHLKDPDSVRYQEITEPREGYTTGIAGGLLMRERRDYGWTVKAILNAKNSRGKYVGFKSYTFLFRGEKIVHTLSPLSEDELN